MKPIIIPTSILAIFVVTAIAAHAADPEPADVPSTWCEDIDDKDGDFPDVPPEASTRQARCSQTVKKYRIADDSNQVCYIRTCCKLTYIDGEWVRVCKDSYVKCETVIVS